MLPTIKNKLAAASVHLFTAWGAVAGLLSVDAIYRQEYLTAFWLMGLAIIIDAMDGTFARLLKVKQVLPMIDGALLDNIVDYFNYVIVPACFLLTSTLLPEGWRLPGAALIIIASAYQFCQKDAKTTDNFFKGFPSYWNIVVIYLFFWQASPLINLSVIIGLILLVFVPIKYVYPSRMEYLTLNKHLRIAMLLATMLWGIATFGLLWIYPKTNILLALTSTGYIILYLVVSLYRTFVALPKLDDIDNLPYSDKSAC